MNNTDEINTTSSNISESFQIIRKSSYYVIPNDIVEIIWKVSLLGISPFLLVLGVILNALCLVMFLRLRNKSSTVIILMGLAVTDILILLNSGVYSINFISRTYSVLLNKEQQLQLACYFSPYLLSIPGRTGNILTLFLSLERLFAVLIPLRIRHYSTRKVAIVVVAFSFLLPVFLGIPFLFMFKVEKVFSNATDQYEPVLGQTSLGRNTQLSDTLYITAETVMRFIPVSGVTLASTVTASVVTVTARRRSMLVEGSFLSKTSRQEMQVTKTLLVITFVYIFCQMPGTILRMIIFLDPEMTPYRFKNNIYDVASAICYLDLLVNSVVNFFIYYKTSSTYNAHFKALFGRHRKANINTTTVSVLQTDSTVSK